MPDSTTAIAAAGSASRRSISRLPTAIAARWATSALAAIGCVSGRSAALDRIDGPPDRVPALHRRARTARVESSIAASAIASGSTAREIPTTPKDDASTSDARGARVPARQPASEAIRRDGRDDGGDDGGEAHPLLGVVPGDEWLEDGEVSRTGGIVRERPVEDVGERSVRRGDDRGLVDVERASPEPDEADDQRERGAEVGQRPIGDGDESSHEVVRAACRISGVCRDTHRPSR